VLNFIAIDL